MKKDQTTYALAEVLLTRRRLLAGAGKAGAGVLLAGLVPNGFALAQSTGNGSSEIKGKEQLIVRMAKPENLETPVALLATRITPTAAFYVRHHGDFPQLDAQTWRLAVGGLVDKPATFTLDELKRMPKREITVTMECAGNGRVYFKPAINGVQWDHGAVGTARFAGVRLADLLRRVGAKSAGRFVILDGADKPIGTQADFIRNVPMEKAMHADTLLAYEMNGAPLLPIHGFPLRALVPAWQGAFSMKWLTQVTVSEREHEGHFVKNAYRYPTHPIAPGATVPPSEMAPVTSLIIKSLITAPLADARVKAGRVKVKGWTWAGENQPVKVELSADNGATWTQARIGRERSPYVWHSFEAELKLDKPGAYTLLSRATDSKGNVQPATQPWNPGGYLWNVIDQVRINVEA